MTVAVVVAAVALATVALAALGVVAYAVHTLARAAHERRLDFLKAAVVERQVEVATTTEALRPATEVIEAGEPDAGTPAAAPEPEPLPTQIEGSYQSHRMREEMISAHLDPDDPEDVRVVLAMREADLDPNNPDHVRYWNTTGEG